MKLAHRKKRIRWRQRAIAATLAVIAAFAVQMPATALSQAAAATAPRGELLICHPPILEIAARSWAEYRTQQGWNVELLPFTSARMDRDGAAEELDAAITAAITVIRAGHRDEDSYPIAVLLLGDAGHANEDSRQLLPTFSRVQRDPVLVFGRDDAHYATDHPFQCIGGVGGRADVALGRIPARTNAQAMAVLDKIRRYEQQRASQPWPMHLEYVAGEGYFGALDRLLETLFLVMIDQLVPDRCTIHVSYAKPDSIYCPPPAELTAMVLRQLSTPAMLFNYVGHGSNRGLGSLRWQSQRFPMLTVEDVAHLPGDAPAAPLALLTCCSAGWFDLAEDEPSLAEALLLHPAGPPAIIAGSRPTHPYANAVVQHAVTEALLAGRFETLGALDLTAMQPRRRSSGSRQLDLIAGPIAIGMQWASTLSQLREMHAELYNLLGDPAMLLPRPTPGFDSLHFRDGLLSGTTRHAQDGEVVVTIESKRTRPANFDALDEPVSRNDPQLPAKAAKNHVIANDRVIRTLRGVLRDGRFSIPLEAASLPAHASLIRVVVEQPAALHGDGTRAVPAAADVLPITLWTRRQR